MTNSIDGVSGGSGPTYSSTGPNLRAFANLNLTDSQTAQIRAILMSAKQDSLSPQLVQSQINAVLTPEQQQQLQTTLQTHKAPHGGHHHHHHAAGATAATTANDLLTSTDVTQTG
jgi:Spy/CpxP family protein refolding chaperone